MKLTVFGPTGGTGLQIVQQAIDAGHDVTVLARSPEKLGDLRNSVSVVEGDVLDARAVGESLEGAEAVDTSVPGFVELFRSLGADITEESA